MNTVYFVLLTLFVAYIATIVKAGGVPASISDSFYRPRIGYVFTAWCVGIGIGVCGLMAELSAGEWYQFLSLLAGGGLMMTGVAPHFRADERTIHYCAAGTCAGAAMAWMCAGGYWYIPVPLVVLAGGSAWLWGRGKIVFRVELALFVSMFIILWIKIAGGG
jgi:hypothetical protein